MCCGGAVRPFFVRLRVVCRQFLAVFCEEERGVWCFVLCGVCGGGGAGCLRCRGESVSVKFLIFGRRCAGPWPAIFPPLYFKAGTLIKI